MSVLRAKGRGGRPGLVLARHHHTEETSRSQEAPGKSGLTSYVGLKRLVGSTEVGLMRILLGAHGTRTGAW